MSGGLLRKPPLKGARITHVARVPSVHSLNMDTYRRTVPKVQPAYLCTHYAQRCALRARSLRARKALLSWFTMACVGSQWLTL